MGLEKKSVFKIENKEYVVLETLVYNGITYGFINEINNENVSEEKYHIIYIKDGNIEFLSNMEIANTLIPLFQEKLLIDLKENNLLGE